MELLKLYKHINNTDVVICPVVKAWRKIKGEVYFIIDAVWFNIVQCRVAGTEPLFLCEEKAVRIRAKDLKNWKYYGEIPSYLRV
jgi:hypothetical protein